MNIENNTGLSFLAPSHGTVESVSPTLAEDGVSSEGFSSALVVQIELLSNMKTEGSPSLQASDIAALQHVGDAVSVPAGHIDTQDFAALLGNDLPSSYKTKDDVDHEAALVAVTDSLKYMSTGFTAEEKVAVAEQNIKKVMAMAVPVEQNLEDVQATSIPVEQDLEGEAVAVPAENNTKNTTAADVQQSMKDTVFISIPVQMDLKQANNKPDKKQAESEPKITAIDDSLQTEEMSAAVIMLPVVMPVEQRKSVDSLTPEDVIKENGLPFFTKSSITGDAKPNQPANTADDSLQPQAVLDRDVLEKQGIYLKYVENSGRAEKTDPAGQPVLSLDGEKTLPRVGADMGVLNKTVVNNDVDVPAITKPLSHPEWNKDLGERIVWMGSKAIPAAEIRLNPQHLGPISVRVDVADNQATVVFTAQHAATREALEASIPKLREMMGAQQIDLVDVNISHGAMSDQGRQQSQKSAQTADGQGSGGAGATVDGVDDIEQEIENGQAVVSKGLLSLYA